MMSLGLLIIAFVSTVYTFPLGFAPDSTAILTPLGNLPETVENAIGAVAKSKTLTPGFPDSGRKMAILEEKFRESIPIKLDNKYGHIQQIVAQIYKPKPIVDTIQEHEKYGNDGDHFRKVANIVIGGMEGLSNTINAVAELPFALVRQVGKSVTTSLNTVGGALVGLA